MLRHPVLSDDIKSIGYDATSKLLEIEFHAGGIYQYNSVPSIIYSSLMSSVSKGSYFSANIRGKYSFTKLS